MTVLNALSIATFLSSYMVDQGLGSGVWLTYILPSALSCRLVLMLRRKASPTETEIRVEHSHMVNEALEMVDMEWRSEQTESIKPSDLTDFQAGP